MKLRVIVRLLEIQRVLVRHRLEDFVRATHLYRPLRFLFYLSPGVWLHRSRRAPRGVRLRLALEELGPIFVKFGQALSTRPDLLPLDLAAELAKLQDDVPPFPGAEARAIIELAYGQPLKEVFAAFDERPLAAASIAQVHPAVLRGGKEVVVKVLRPQMMRVIRRDIEVLYALAELAHRYWLEARRLRPVEVVREYEKTITDELDLMREAANAAQLKHNFSGSELLYVPQVYWDHCRMNVMVMERIYGIPISDLEQLRRLRVNIPKLAENGVEIFFTQVFRHNFFHADMHPGNIFVIATDPENPRYAAVDFGIVGTLSSRDQYYLAENFLAFFDRDYYRVAKLHLDSGWVPPHTRIDELESAVRTVCEPVFNKPLKDISFGQVLVRLFDIARRFDMEVQPQLVLLEKTLLNIEGLGRQLYPELDLWKTAQPILRQWMRERVGPRAILKNLRAQMPELAEAAKTLPRLLYGAIRQADDGRLQLKVESTGVEELRRTVREGNKQRNAITVSTALLLGGIVWLALARDPAWPGWLFGIVGASWLLRAWRKV